MKTKKATFLIAMPSIGDPLFEKTLIFMSDNAEQGFMGVIIDKPTEAMLQHLLELSGFTAEERGCLPEMPILFGGPVQANHLWALHAPGLETQATMKFTQEVALTPVELMIDPLLTGECPEIFQVGVGYSGWGPNQLEGEIERGAWWRVELNLDELLLAPPLERWNRALEMLGVHPDELFDRTDPEHPALN